jgi:hypothetical protein
MRDSYALAHEHLSPECPQLDLLTSGFRLWIARVRFAARKTDTLPPLRIRLLSRMAHSISRMVMVPPFLVLFIPIPVSATISQTHEINSFYFISRCSWRHGR